MDIGCAKCCFFHVCCCWFRFLVMWPWILCLEFIMCLFACLFACSDGIYGAPTHYRSYSTVDTIETVNYMESWSSMKPTLVWMSAVDVLVWMLTIGPFRPLVRHASVVLSLTPIYVPKWGLAGIAATLFQPGETTHGNMNAAQTKRLTCLLSWHWVHCRWCRHSRQAAGPGSPRQTLSGSPPCIWWWPPQQLGWLP